MVCLEKLLGKSRRRKKEDYIVLKRAVPAFNRLARGSIWVPAQHLMYSEHNCRLSVQHQISTHVRHCRALLPSFMQLKPYFLTHKLVVLIIVAVPNLKEWQYFERKASHTTRRVQRCLPKSLSSCKPPALAILVMF